MDDCLGSDIPQCYRWRVVYIGFSTSWIGFWPTGVPGMVFTRPWSRALDVHPQANLRVGMKEKDARVSQTRTC